MQVYCYSIFDQCSGIYEKPFFSTTDELVKREFMDVATAADHPIANHPEHYSLHRLASMDNTTGKITNEENICLITGLEAVSESRRVDPKQMQMLQEEVDFMEPDKKAALNSMYKPGLTD